MKMARWYEGVVLLLYVASTVFLYFAVVRDRTVTKQHIEQSISEGEIFKVNGYTDAKIKADEPFLVRDQSGKFVSLQAVSTTDKEIYVSTSPIEPGEYQVKHNNITLEVTGQKEVMLTIRSDNAKVILDVILWIIFAFVVGFVVFVFEIMGRNMEAAEANTAQEEPKRLILD